MISTSGVLSRELNKIGDDFVIAHYTDKNGEKIELIIDDIARIPYGGDGRQSIIRLSLRDGGQGCLKQ